MSETESAVPAPEIPGTPAVAEASAGLSLIAGVAAAAITFPLGAIGFPVAFFLRQRLLARAMGHDVEFEETLHGGTAWITDVLMMLMAGLISAAIATFLVTLVVKRARLKPFSLAAGAGYVVLAALTWRWLAHRHPVSIAYDFNILLAWIGAMAGAIAIILVQAEEDSEKSAEMSPV
jgi:hypothetical protein